MLECDHTPTNGKRYRRSVSTPADDQRETVISGMLEGDVVPKQIAETSSFIRGAGQPDPWPAL